MEPGSLGEDPPEFIDLSDSLLSESRALLAELDEMLARSRPRPREAAPESAPHDG